VLLLLLVVDQGLPGVLGSVPLDSVTLSGSSSSSRALQEPVQWPSFARRLRCCLLLTGSAVAAACPATTAAASCLARLHTTQGSCPSEPLALWLLLLLLRLLQFLLLPALRQLLLFMLLLRLLWIMLLLVLLLSWVGLLLYAARRLRLLHPPLVLQLQPLHETLGLCCCCCSSTCMPCSSCCCSCITPRCCVCLLPRCCCGCTCYSSSCQDLRICL
jgi:hypothetical protein